MSIREEFDIGRLLERLETHPEHGLTQVEADNRLRKYGTNELERPYVRFAIVRSAALLCLAMGIVLAVEGVFIHALGVTALGAFLILLATLLQTRYKRTTKAAEAPFPAVCSVIRGGRLMRLPGIKLVPGDLVRIELEDVIPADGRLTEAVDLVVAEELLSGTPEPVTKDALSASTPLSVRTLSGAEACKNQVFMGTVVVKGRGTFVVTQTGLKTRIGIAKSKGTEPFT